VIDPGRSIVTVKEIFFSQGRLNRQPYFAWTAGLAILSVVLFEGVLAIDDTSEVPRVLIVFVYLPLFAAASVQLSVKRLRDRNKSGWVLLPQLLPIVGLIFSIWFFVQACLPGTRGTIASVPIQCSGRKQQARNRSGKELREEATSSDCLNREKINLRRL
jgi:uncharacterized membrane protein YhaH (DUF805 family)